MTIESWNGAMLILTDALLIAALLSQPYLSKATLFGVIVPESARSDERLKELRKRYVARMALWCVALLIVSVAAIVAADLEAAILIAATPLIQIVVSFVLMARGRREALRLKEEKGWHFPDSGRRVANLGFRQRMKPFTRWYAVHVLVIAACAVAAIVQWDRLPDVFASHFNFAGEADGFSNKTIGSVFALNFIQLGLTFMFLLIDLSIRATRQSLDPNKPEQSLDRQVRFRQANAVFLWALSLAVVLLFGAIQGQMLYAWPVHVIIGLAVAAPLLIIGGVIAFMAYLSNKGLEQQNDGPQTDDRHWRGGGHFYYNPDNPSLVVDKRIGIGWTFNYARPMSWVITFGIVAVPLAVVIVAIALDL